MDSIINWGLEKKVILDSHQITREFWLITFSKPWEHENCSVGEMCRKGINIYRKFKFSSNISHLIWHLLKGQTNSKWFFQADVSSKKQTNKFDFTKGGFKSEDTGEFLHLQRKYSKSLSWAENLLRIVIWNIYVGDVNFKPPLQANLAITFWSP